MDAEIRKALLENLTVPVDVAGKALGLQSKTSAYAAVEAGQIPSIRIGRKIRCPTAPLLKMLGIEAA